MLKILFSIIFGIVSSIAFGNDEVKIQIKKKDLIPNLKKYKNPTKK